MQQIRRAWLTLLGAKSQPQPSPSTSQDGFIACRVPGTRPLQAGSCPLPHQLLLHTMAGFAPILPPTYPEGCHVDGQQLLVREGEGAPSSTVLAAL